MKRFLWRHVSATAYGHPVQEYTTQEYTAGIVPAAF
jgi:hypothetical protein